MVFERVDPGGRDIGVGSEVSRIVEPGAGIAALMPAVGPIMLVRIDAGCGHVRIVEKVEARVEAR
jgi:hypothetical protein